MSLLHCVQWEPSCLVLTDAGHGPPNHLRPQESVGFIFYPLVWAHVLVWVYHLEVGCYRKIPEILYSLIMSDFATPWTVVRQAPLAMGFFRYEYWRGCMPFSRGSSQPRDRLVHWQLGSLPLAPSGKPIERSLRPPILSLGD